MSKRLIDITKHRRAMRKKPVELRLAYHWLLENANSAGIWEIDLDLYEFEVGVKLDVEALLASMPGIVVLLRDRKHLLLPDVIEANNGRLMPNYNPHRPIIRALKDAGIVQREDRTLIYEDGDMPVVDAIPPEPEAIPVKAVPITVPATKGRHPAATRPARDPRVEQLLAHLLELNEGSLDGTDQDNRRDAAKVIEMIARKYPKHDPVEFIMRLMDLTKQDKFHGPNLTSFKYLVNHSTKIINLLKQQHGKDPKEKERNGFNASLAAALGAHALAPA